MSIETYIALGGMLGLSTIVTILLNYYLSRRTKDLSVAEETSKAKLEYSAGFQKELWAQIEELRNRYDELNKHYASALQEGAAARAEKDVLNSQLAYEKQSKQEHISELVARYATAAQQKEDSDFRREREKEKFERKIDDLEVLVDGKNTEISTLTRRINDLEHDLARITRGGPTRSTDCKQSG